MSINNNIDKLIQEILIYEFAYAWVVTLVKDILVATGIEYVVNYRSDNIINNLLEIEKNNQEYIKMLENKNRQLQEYIDYQKSLSFFKKISIELGLDLTSLQYTTSGIALVSLLVFIALKYKIFNKHQVRTVVFLENKLKKIAYSENYNVKMLYDKLISERDIKIKSQTVDIDIFSIYIEYFSKIFSLLIISRLNSSPVKYNNLYEFLDYNLDIYDCLEDYKVFFNEEKYYNKTVENFNSLFKSIPKTESLKLNRIKQNITIE